MVICVIMLPAPCTQVPWDRDVDLACRAIKAQEAAARFQPHVQASRRKGPVRVVGQAPADWQSTMMALSGGERVTWKTVMLTPSGGGAAVELEISGTVRNLHATHGGFKLFLFEVVPDPLSARPASFLSPVVVG